MTTNDTATEKGIAQDYCFDAYCVGVDETGASHYWSSYFWTVVVINSLDDVEIHSLDRDARELSDWRDHVAQKRGWSDCRIGGSIITDAAVIAEAHQ